MDISELVDAINTLNAPDAFRAGFSLLQWQTIENYLIPFEMKADEVLIEQGETDRVCYFVGRGSLQVYVTGGPPGGAKIAILRAGAIVGEPSLFGDGTRMASVSTLTPCTLWALSSQRFEQMAQRVPPLALDFLRAAGVVMAVRMRATLARQAPFT
jgi:CRP/FNR family transcriptional regulator, cyclic AMP receptor protein